MAALRNRARTQHRERLRRRERVEHLYSTLDATTERVVAECHSEYGLRTMVPAGGEPEPVLMSAIEQLAERAARALSAADLALMVGLGRRIPLRELAALGGISYGAARVRVHRLRERLRNIAVEHVASLGPDEQREMTRFLRRAGIELEPPTSADHTPDSPTRESTP